jgi:hypothetical protein
MNRRRAAACLSLVVGLSLVPAAAGGGLSSIAPDDLREWLTYVSSDELAGRDTFSPGLGLAAGYIQSYLKQWNVRPAGDRGTYLQAVRVLGIRATSRSTVTVRVGGDSRTFVDGEDISLPRQQGGARAVTATRVEFAGYGLHVPEANLADYAGTDVRGAAVVWLGANGPKGFDAQRYRQLLTGRHRYATDQQHALAVIAPAANGAGGEIPPPARGRGAAAPATGRGAAAPAPDFVTARRLDTPVAPTITASDAFLTFLFSKAPTPYAELKRKAAAQEPLPSFRLEGVSITINIDVDYAVVRTQLTHNVVGIVEGSDPVLRQTYVAMGAHYDHVGYAEREPPQGSERPAGAPGRVTPGTGADRIWNGADDNGSGTVGLMALARAFAEGPRPKRSLLFVWHTGEEEGLYGSRYFADYPTVPIDAIVAQLNIDMIGRNRDDRPEQAGTVYLVGSDRISSELHEINRQANRALPRPLTLDYEMNDPSDPEQIYFRSDHYSYAVKGIPVIFFTTGLHADYHANTDEVSKIDFEKVARITGLVYETAERLANLDRAPARDNRGPRAGKGTP